MKLIIKDSGDPEVGIPEVYYEVDCPFPEAYINQKGEQFFRQLIESAYNDFAQGRISSRYETEIKKR